MRIIGGKFRGKTITSPLHLGTRPTSDRTRETIYNILLHNPAFVPNVLHGKKILDVYAGTGGLGLEAYSRGAKAVTFIENDKAALTILHKNVQAFALPSSCILEQDACCLKISPPFSFDLVFLDPPYHSNLIPTTLQCLISQQWLSQKAVLVLEIAKDESLYLPPSVHLVTERISGAAKILFCTILNERLLSS